MADTGNTTEVFDLEHLDIGKDLFDGADFNATLLPMIFYDDAFDAGGPGTSTDMDSESSSGESTVFLSSVANPPNYWTLLLLVFPLMTAFGNVLVCVSVYSERSLRTVTNYFIVSLAVADIMVAVLVMPPAVYVEVNNAEWELGDVLCDTWVAFDVMSCTASILNLTAISVDRFTAVTRPISYARQKTSRRVYVMIAVPWIVSIAISSPIVLGLNYTEHRSETPTMCTFYNADFLIYSSMGSFYIPSVVMTLLYGRIYLAIRSRSRSSGSGGSGCSNSGGRSLLGQQSQCGITSACRPSAWSRAIESLSAAVVTSPRLVVRPVRPTADGVQPGVENAFDGVLAVTGTVKSKVFLTLPVNGDLNQPIVHPTQFAIMAPVVSSVISPVGHVARRDYALSSPSGDSSSPVDERVPDRLIPMVSQRGASTITVISVTPVIADPSPTEDDGGHALDPPLVIGEADRNATGGVSCSYRPSLTPPVALVSEDPVQAHTSPQLSTPVSAVIALTSSRDRTCVISSRRST